MRRAVLVMLVGVPAGAWWLWAAWRLLNEWSLGQPFTVQIDLRPAEPESAERVAA